MNRRFAIKTALVSHVDIIPYDDLIIEIAGRGKEYEYDPQYAEYKVYYGVFYIGLEPIAAIRRRTLHIFSRYPPYYLLQYDSKYYLDQNASRPLHVYGNRILGVTDTPYQEEIDILAMFVALLPQPIAEEICDHFLAMIAERRSNRIYFVHPYGSQEHYVKHRKTRVLWLVHTIYTRTRPSGDIFREAIEAEIATAV
jgi:hypothetical protein